MLKQTQTDLLKIQRFILGATPLVVSTSVPVVINNSFKMCHLGLPDTWMWQTLNQNWCVWWRAGNWDQMVSEPFRCLTGHLNGTRRDVEVITEQIGEQHNDTETSHLTPVGVAIFDGTRHFIDSRHSPGLLLHHLPVQRPRCPTEA